jgi:hypothetical protein
MAMSHTAQSVHHGSFVLFVSMVTITSYEKLEATWSLWQGEL